MKTQLAAARDAVRLPSVQDAGLAALLLAGSVRPSEPVRWVLVVICVGAVAVRRRWPATAFVAASLAAVVQMALGAGPVAAHLAVPITLYTIAARRRPAASLAVLGATLVTVTAWSAYVTLDGRTDGWSYKGPFGRGGQVSGGQVSGGEGRVGGSAGSGPTDWGGIVVLGSLLVVAWAIGWGVRSRRAYLRELVAAQARELVRERDQQAELAVAAERARITRELHDVVAHGLAVIVMQAQGGAAAFAKRPADTLAALDTIVATGRASLADMRQVLSASEPVDGPPRPVPGLAQLARLVDQVRQAGTAVQLHRDGSPRPLPTGVDVAAYRIVQEALTNTMKHAGPGAHAKVRISYGKEQVTIEATDDGAGPPTAGGTGNGLRGMRERVALLRGEVTAGPAPAGGYVVHARLPLDPDRLLDSDRDPGETA
jgi:signal transduction histidine kinase